MKKMPFNRKTCPLILEIEFGGGQLLCIEKTATTAFFAGNAISWIELMQYRQTNGEPCCTTKAMGSPFTKKTAPRWLEVEIDGDLVMCSRKCQNGAWFNENFYSWEELMEFKQWDGSPCYVTENHKSGEVVYLPGEE